MDPLTLLPVAAGIALLVFGRRLFWLLVAAAGFLAGFWLTVTFLEYDSGSTPMIVGLVGGIVGALLALFAQKIAISVGGFLAGGYGLMILAAGIAGLGNIPEWIPFLVGGVLGAVLLRQVFEWTLIVLTSLIGAILITHYLTVGASLLVPLTVLIAAVGIVIQVRSRRKK